MNMLIEERQFEVQVWAVNEFCVGYVQLIQVEVPSKWTQSYMDLKGERFNLRFIGLGFAN